MGATLTQTKTITTNNGEGKLLDAVLEASDKRKTVVASAAAILGVEPSKLCGLLRNVWRTSKGSEPLTDAEMFTGISLIARYELDPIAREVYVTRTKGGLVTIIGIDGWIKVLDRTDHYDGFTVDIHHDDHGKVDWVDTTIHSKTRKHPTTYRAFASEYAKVAGFVAGQMPTHMLRVFGLRHAARLFTPIGGNVLTEEEALYMQQHDTTDFTKPIPQTVAELAKQIAEPEVAQEPVADEPAPLTVAELIANINGFTGDKKQLSAFVAENSKHLTNEEYASVGDAMEAKAATLKK